MLPQWGPHHALVIHPCSERRSASVGQDLVAPRVREGVVGYVGCKHAREIWVHAGGVGSRGFLPPHPEDLRHYPPHTISRSSLDASPSRLPPRQRHSMTSGGLIHTRPGTCPSPLCTGNPPEDRAAPRSGPSMRHISSVYPIHSLAHTLPTWTRPYQGPSVRVPTVVVIKIPYQRS